MAIPNPRASLITVITFAVTLLTVGLVRYQASGGSQASCFWIDKFLHQNSSDVVIAGDSRVYEGVDPEPFKVALEGPAFNYAFLGTGWENRYLDAVEKVLVDNGRPRFILLGISPYEFTPQACKTNKFIEHTYLARNELMLHSVFGRFNDFFASIDENDVSALRGRVPKNRKIVMHDNGWGEVVLPEDLDPVVEKETIQHYQGLFKNNAIDPQTIQGLLARVKLWRQKGIQVFGFRPPTSAQLAQAETAASGFDYEAFTRNLKEAGAIWVELDPAKYRTWDGSHLLGREAVRYSADLSALVQTQRTVK